MKRIIRKMTLISSMMGEDSREDSSSLSFLIMTHRYSSHIEEQEEEDKRKLSCDIHPAKSADIRI